jgi:hypothetical protein
VTRLLAPIAVLVVTTIVTTSHAHAWNNTGHMITGAIAYRDATPEARAAALALLREHPEYASRWSRWLARQRVPRAAQGEALFMLAARWPDDVRDDPRQHRGEWHYVNFPFHPGRTAQGEPPPGESILTAFERQRATLSSSVASQADKAVALCWLFHLVGDVHQPLHTTALFTPAFPEGDRGGTLFFIRPSSRGDVISLHAFWDGLGGRGDRIREAANAATLLLGRPGMKRQDFPALGSRDFAAWAKHESYEIAARFVYRDGTLPGSSDDRQAPVLPPGYARGAKALGERRLVLAGYRLADLLSSLSP